MYDRFINWLVGGGLIAVLLATWRTARQSKDLEAKIDHIAAVENKVTALEEENAELREFIAGNDMTGRKGMVRDVAETKELATYASRVTKLLFRAFRVPSGSSDTEVISHIRDAVNNSNVTHTGEWPAVQPPHDPRPAGTLPKRTIRPFNKPIPRDE
jgi:hypothetical protein